MAPPVIIGLAWHYYDHDDDDDDDDNDDDNGGGDDDDDACLYQATPLLPFCYQVIKLRTIEAHNLLFLYSV